ncbi:IS30 family transposase [Mailhella massiliensis]|uniref:IS30 family transposase n=1 Tax=Mailhella massiliensis TaxID=1903261 RepID=A0A921DS40_9BACT|nr:IS30 family transposase [Mailhella massiliensis]HJD97758.1 IS30 family transposase [Mailhella massiliensis]
MLLTRRQPDKPAAAANNLCSIRTLNGLYTEFGIDPKSRLLLSLKIPRKTSAHVRDGMIRLLSELPPELVRSVTPDRGKEFAKHDEISAALNNVPFFFPPPHAPWMRGTNENTNGLIREYCPKSTDLECFDSAFFTAFTSKINLRPRKCLGWRSPFEVFFNQLLHLT